MKKIFCPICGEEMLFFEDDTDRDNFFAFRCPSMSCAMRTIRIYGISEKDTRKAWHDGLIGRLRKAHKNISRINEPYIRSGSVTDILVKMFGWEK